MTFFIYFTSRPTSCIEKHVFCFYQMKDWCSFYCFSNVLTYYLIPLITFFPSYRFLKTLMKCCFKFYLNSCSNSICQNFGSICISIFHRSSCFFGRLDQLFQTKEILKFHLWKYVFTPFSYFQNFSRNNFIFSFYLNNNIYHAISNPRLFLKNNQNQRNTSVSINS